MACYILGSNDNQLTLIKVTPPGTPCTALKDQRFNLLDSDGVPSIDALYANINSYNLQYSKYCKRIRNHLADNYAYTHYMRSLLKYAVKHRMDKIIDVINLPNKWEYRLIYGMKYGYQVELCEKFADPDMQIVKSRCNALKSKVCISLDLEAFFPNINNTEIIGEVLGYVDTNNINAFAKILKRCNVKNATNVLPICLYKSIIKNRHHLVTLILVYSRTNGIGLNSPCIFTAVCKAASVEWAKMFYELGCTPLERHVLLSIEYGSVELTEYLTSICK